MNFKANENKRLGMTKIEKKIQLFKIINNLLSSKFEDGMWKEKNYNNN